LIATAASLASPFALAQKRAQSPVIGILSLTKAPSAGEWSKDPRAQRLRELGWVEGTTVVLVHAWAEGRPERLAELAAELVRKRVDVILAVAPAAAVAAARATKTIPIVFQGIAFPIELGLVPSLARPAGNVTGVAWVAGGGEQIVKSIEFLKQMVPSVNRLASIASPSTSTTVAGGTVVYPDAQSALSKLGIERKIHSIELASDLEKTFAAIHASGAQAVFIPLTPFSWANRQRIVDFANRHRLPTASDHGSIVDAGGLVSYGPYLQEIQRRAIEYVDRVLRGTPPADLPVELPSKYELAVNLKTAKALGITVPQSILIRADRVIE
jgi:putative ABC transport system substrate-binding protein